MVSKGDENFTLGTSAGRSALEGLGGALEGLGTVLEGFGNELEGTEGSIETLCMLGLEALAGGGPMGSGGRIAPEIMAC